MGYDDYWSKRWCWRCSCYWVVYEKYELLILKGLSEYIWLILNWNYRINWFCILKFCFWFFWLLEIWVLLFFFGRRKEEIKKWVVWLINWVLVFIVVKVLFIFFICRVFFLIKGKYMWGFFCEDLNVFKFFFLLWVLWIFFIFKVISLYFIDINYW